ncbi:hypothetical protein [Lutimonas vermicola]|uniref:Outer membrane protein beta-barrel domain-containing protein n=1 Tax=Lutimonas vermicola TaxID=414288 RepID=A0ABU9KY44_9FLAO
MRKPIIILLLFLAAIEFNAQNRSYKITPFKLMSYSGNINVNGQFNNTFFEDEQGFHYGYHYGVGGFLATQSYVYHPNFLTLSISGGYQPQFGEVVSSLMPDYLNNLSTAQYNILARFFQTLDYNLNAYLRHDEKRGEDRFYDRDIATNRYGLDFKYEKDYKINANFEHRTDRELDNLTDRELVTASTGFRAKVNKSFFKNDWNELFFNLQNTLSESKNLFSNSNNLMNAYLSNSLFLNRKKSIPLRSRISIQNQSGTFETKNAALTESINIPLAKNFHFGSTFAYRWGKRNEELINELRYSGGLAYSLYESFTIGVDMNYNDLDQKEDFSLTNTVLSLNVNYNKQIKPIKGKLDVRYKYAFENQLRKSQDTLSVINVFNENQLLRDGQINILNNPNVLLETVLVKDVTNTVFYQENIDYLLVERGVNVEIQRLIGGAIPNNTSVFVDYSALQLGSYEYESPGSFLDINLTFFDELIRLNYMNSFRKYTALSGNIDNLGLNEFKQYKIGLHMRYKMFGAGIFYEDIDGSVLPHKLWNYYVSATGNIGRKLNYKFTGMINDYVLYFREGDTNLLMTFSSDIMYNISRNTRLFFNLSFSSQQGDIQDYLLASGRTELKQRWKKLELSFGANYYERHVPLQDFASKYVNTYIKLQRNF